MIKRMIIMLMLVGVVLGGFFGFQAFKAKMIHKILAQLSNPPQAVSTTKAAVQPWQPQIHAVGTLRAEKGANLSLEVSGIVDKINFKSGEDVKSGDELLRLRTDDDEAKLQALQAKAHLAQITYDRDLKQLRAQTISQATLDTDRANLQSAQAQVDEQKAAIAKKILRAPFAGHLGIRQVDVGQFLNAGTSVVTLQSLDPIYLDFYLPQQELAKIRVGQRVVAHVDVFPKQTFPGRILAVNPQVDPNSRNVQVRAVLNNPDHKLLPGMFATLNIDSGAVHHYVTLPQTSIAYNPYGSTVFLVEHVAKGLTVRQTFVTTGETRGDQVAVLKGVKPGDVVVTAGQIKLHNGSPVKINNSVQPSDAANPTPAED